MKGGIMQKPEIFEDMTGQICNDFPGKRNEEETQELIRKLKEPLPTESDNIDFKMEFRYFFPSIDPKLDNKIEYWMSMIGQKRYASGYNFEKNMRDLCFESAVIKPTWIHINTKKQYLALLKGIEVIEEYNINKGLKWYGISHVTRKIFDVKDEYGDEPSGMLEGALTGTGLELDIFKFDNRCGYRNVAIHGTMLHEKLTLGKDDGTKEQIIRLVSDGCVLLSNDDMFYVYENVEIGCPVVFDDNDVFKNLIPNEILDWCDINKVVNVLEHLAKGST